AHRRAAAMDGHWELVCGAFSGDAAKSHEFGKNLGLEESRAYGSFEEMISAESTLPSDRRIHAVAIVTPNHVHAAPAIMALEHGFHVIVDKPLALSSDEAVQVRGAVRKSGLHLAL